MTPEERDPRLPPDLARGESVTPEEPGSQSPPENLEWLLEPPGPGQFQLFFRAGSDLSAKQRAALENLVRSLHEEEVEGFVWTSGPYAHCEKRSASDCDLWCKLDPSPLPKPPRPKPP